MHACTLTISQSREIIPTYAMWGSWTKKSTSAPQPLTDNHNEYNMRRNLPPGSECLDSFGRCFWWTSSVWYEIVRVLGDCAQNARIPATVAILIFIEQITVICQTQMKRSNAMAAMMDASRKYWMRHILDISIENGKEITNTKTWNKSIIGGKMLHDSTSTKCLK